MAQYPVLDLSGGLQSKTSHILRKRSEVHDSSNAAYHIKLGSAVRRLGYEKVGLTIQNGNDSLYGGVYNYFQNNKLIVGINDSGNTSSTLQYLDGDNYWKTIFTSSSPNIRFNCLNYLDEFYVAGASGNDNYLTLRNIDYTLTASTTRGVLNAPRCKFIAEFQGDLWAINCKIGNSVYKDRAYRSSNTLSVTYLTRVQTDQKGLLQQLRVDSVQYLKPTMTIDIWGSNSNEQKVSSLTIISVDKKNNKISFAPTSINVLDNDELWLVGRHNLVTAYWNTDYPDPNTAPFIQASSEKEADPEFTGYGKNNNRFYLFTKNSFIEYDGNNERVVSDTIGCESHETIQNIGSWILWLHKTGVWGYNTSSGQLQLLSKAIQDKIDAIQQVNLSKASAVVVGRVYKLAVGELIDLTFDTTSTSTSSTSTSSTSSSTSSTSTSSTSTSSTSISTSSTSRSTSTSSTSVSTSSTSSTSASTSSTSMSVSTSTSSTTTTTSQSTKKVVRLVYDLDANTWGVETHRREIRFQFLHTMHGYTKPYFTDETGRLFRDETGHLDNEDTIPMTIELGRDNFGTNERKSYQTAVIDSEAARGAIIQYSIDGGEFQTLGQVTNLVTVLPFPARGQQITGRDINYRVVHNQKGSQAIINGINTYFNSIEGMPNESSRL